MRKFREKPKEVGATQWFKHGDHHAVSEHPDIPDRGVLETSPYEERRKALTVCPGDWIVWHDGEYAVMEDDVFRAKYEPALSAYVIVQQLSAVLDGLSGFRHEHVEAGK